MMRVARREKKKNEGRHTDDEGGEKGKKRKMKGDTQMMRVARREKKKKEGRHTDDEGGEKEKKKKEGRHTEVTDGIEYSSLL